MGVQHVRVFKYPSRECVYAVKGSALVVPQMVPQMPAPSGRSPAPGVGPAVGPTVGPGVGPSPGRGSGSDIQRHLQDMLGLIRAADNLRMAVRLESGHAGRSRYLVVVASTAADECCLLGIDCQRRTSIGLVHRLLAETEIALDGDGGIVVRTAGDSHTFKPVSIQAMWSALQTLHRCRSVVPRPLTRPDWVSPYDQLVASDQSCLNEWHAMEDIESRRPASPDSRRNCVPSEKEETQRVIRARLREIMLSVDLDQVTSKELRLRLEQEMACCLKLFKSFIDNEMLVIMGQMDRASPIFDHLYLGSEWNASDIEELKRNGIGHILNVTREIDNFFPGRFQYLNIRVYDEEATELLKHWDKTFKFITKAKGEGSRVLVHCRMGVSRSAAVVIAYAMKAYGWSYEKAVKYVRQRRGCVKPNASFLRQLETYQGILDASKQRHNSLWRSKSETNLQSRRLTSPPAVGERRVPAAGAGRSRPLSPATESAGGRPKSWSPAADVTDALLAHMNGPHPYRARPHRARCRSQTLPTDAPARVRAATPVNARVPCNGQDYRVSQNQAMNLSLPLEPLCSDGALQPDRSPPVVFECINRQLVAAAETWVGQVVELRSTREPAPAAGLVRRQAEDFERRSSSSDGGARGSCGSAELAPPSRQSSWSSLEGALLRAAGVQSPSRSSSWGSYDAAHTVAADVALPAGEVGSPVAVRLAGPPTSPPAAVSRMSVQLRQPIVAPRALGSTHHAVSLLNLSAQGGGPCRPSASSVSLTDELATDQDETTSTPGQVRRLALQLERRGKAAGRSVSLDKLNNGTVPTAGSPSPTDEVSVRCLVGRFESPRQPDSPRRADVEPSRVSPPVRKASLDLSRLASFTRRNLGQVFGRHRASPVVRTAAHRPPPPPAGPRPAAPGRKRLHGKTHPLAKLDVRTRHVNSVFNTM